MRLGGRFGVRQAAITELPQFDGGGRVDRAAGLRRLIQSVAVTKPQRAVWVTATAVGVATRRLVWTSHNNTSREVC